MGVLRTAEKFSVSDVTCDGDHVPVTVSQTGCPENGRPAESILELFCCKSDVSGHACVARKMGVLRLANNLCCD